MDGKSAVIDSIKSRRSVRKFKEKPVPKEIIDKILEAGRFAPSALNMQPWKFIVIQDKALIEEMFSIAKKRLTRLYGLMPVLKIFSGQLKDERVANAIKKTAVNTGDTVFYNAPLVIFIANDKTKNASKEDCVLAAQNMMLAAHSLGVGSCFIGRGKAIPISYLLNKFNLPVHYDITVHLAFGYSDEPSRTPPHRHEDTILWVR